MDRDQILQQLKAERDRLTRAIEALDGHNTYKTAQAVSSRGKTSSRKGISAAGRRRLSQLMKKRWAERRKATKKA